jgi:RimJ/RimL family protein N-acetyltransferase
MSWVEDEDRGRAAFNLHRVWLTTSSFNERAVKLYAKLGFRHEGRGREHIHRDERWWDMVYMGLLRDQFNE